MTGWLVAAAICVAPAVIGLASRSSAQEAGVIVPPNYGGAGILVTDMTPVEVSLWEYSDPNHHITTGKHIVFAIPAAYFVISGNLKGGPQSALWLRFDLQNGRPWLVGGAGEILPGATAAAGLSRYSRQVDFNVTTDRITLGRYAPEASMTFDPEPAIVEGDVRAVRVPGEHCGFQLFDSGESWGTVRRPDGPVDIQSIQMPPFGDARYFVRQAASGEYTLIAHCNPSLTGIYPWCSVGSQFEGWEMNVWVSGEHLCRLDDVIEKSRGLLNQSVSRRTDASD